MTVRPAIASDHADLVRLGTSFYAESSHGGGPADVARMTHIVDSVLAHGTIAVVEDRGGTLRGLLALLVGPHPLTGIPTGMDVAWYLEPGARGGPTAVRLVREAEQAAKDAGATRIQIGAPDARVQTFLERLAYRAVETTMVRELD
jgi:GNAT superfamily N-acetyltransferase